MAKVHFSFKQPMAGEEKETVTDPSGHGAQCQRELTLCLLTSPRAQCSCEGGGREREGRGGGLSITASKQERRRGTDAEEGLYINSESA